MSYVEDMRQEDQANYEDAVREDVLSKLRRSPEVAAQELAVEAIGQDHYDEWRGQSYDVPTIEEHVDLALEEIGHGDLAKLVGIDYKAQEMREVFPDEVNPSRAEALADSYDPDELDEFDRWEGP